LAWIAKITTGGKYRKVLEYALREGAHAKFRFIDVVYHVIKKYYNM
jgi:hypothetical protein